MAVVDRNEAVAQCLNPLVTRAFGFKGISLMTWTAHSLIHNFPMKRNGSFNPSTKKFIQPFTVHKIGFY